MANISQSVKHEIIVSIVEPSYKTDIKRNFRLKKLFKNMGLTFEILSKLFVGITSIISFASGIYRIEVLSFLAGTTSVVSLVLLQYSSYSYRESKKITAEINDIFKKLNMDTIIESSDTSNLDNSSDHGSGDQPITPLNKN
jgi:hypothetical protein